MDAAEAADAADAEWHAAKRAYYCGKLNLPSTDDRWQAERDRMCYAYVEGIQWVLSYYYNGACPGRPTPSCSCSRSRSQPQLWLRP